MDFVVHSVIGSPSGRAVLVTLEEKGASYRLEPLGPGAAKYPEHLARHPFGRVPVLDHGDFSLYETQAIVRYIDRILPTPALTPTDPRRAARMDQAMNVNDWYLFQGVSNVIVFQRVVGPKMFGRQPDEAVIDAAMPKARIVFRELGRLLGDLRGQDGRSFSPKSHQSPVIAVSPSRATAMMRCSSGPCCLQPL